MNARQEHHAILVAYLKSKVEAADWHAVSDARERPESTRGPDGSRARAAAEAGNAGPPDNHVSKVLAMNPRARRIGASRRKAAARSRTDAERDRLQRASWSFRCAEQKADLARMRSEDRAADLRELSDPRITEETRPELLQRIQQEQPR